MTHDDSAIAYFLRKSKEDPVHREVNLERLPCEAAWRIYSDLVNLSVPVTLIVHEEDIESLFENSYGRKSEGESMGRTVALGFENKVVQPFAGNTESGQGLHGIEVSGQTWFVTADHFTLRT